MFPPDDLRSRPETLYWYISISIRMYYLYEFCYRTYIYIHKECRSVLVKLHPITVYRTVFGVRGCCVECHFFVFFGLPIVSCSMINSLILGCLWHLIFVLNNNLTLGIWLSAISHPQDVLTLDFLSEYWIQHGVIGPLYVTSSYSTWIFGREVSGFATDLPYGLWCRRSTTCLI